MNDYPCSLLDLPSLIIYLRSLVGVSLKAFKAKVLLVPSPDSEMPSGTWTCNMLNTELILEELPSAEYTVLLMFEICVKRYPDIAQ